MQHLEQTNRVLEEIELFGRANDPAEQERTRKMLNLERDTARVMELFILSSRCKRILEIGTSNGFSAIWIASLLRSIGADAPLITIEIDPKKAELAATNIEKAGLSEWVNILVGDATEIVSLVTGPFDSIFFDADRISAASQLRILLPKLSADALLMADNALSHPEEIAGYLAAIAALPEFTCMTIPVGKGLSVAVRRISPESEIL
jgi:predicted O-methyltransferase YrrM